MDKHVNKINISSSDGWNQIEFHLSNFSNEILATIVAKGKFWAKNQNYNIDSAQLVDDFDVNLFQVIFSKDKLILLKKLLESWFSDPREISIEISAFNCPKVSIFIGESDEFICSKIKPVFVLNYQDSRVETKVKFIVDQSCLNLMFEDLKKWIYLSQAQ